MTATTAPTPAAFDNALAAAWTDSLFAAWRDRDAERIVRLFAPTAEYRAHPFRPPLIGHAAILTYWRQALASQRRLDLHAGTPLVADNRAAVEWWSALEEDGSELTFAGTLFLRFDDSGLCTSLREVWAQQPGRRAPYAGWGS